MYQVLEQLITLFLLLALICDLFAWQCNCTWTVMLEHFFCVNSLMLLKLWVSQTSSPLQMRKALICAGFTARNSHHRHPIVLITFQKWNKKTVLNLCCLKPCECMLQSQHMPCSSVFRNHISNCFQVILTPLQQHILNINPTEDFLNSELWIFSHFHYLLFSEGSLPFRVPGLFQGRLMYDAAHLANCLTLKQSLTALESVFLSLNFGPKVLAIAALFKL